MNKGLRSLSREAVFNVVLVMFVLVALYPIYMLFSTSLKTPAEFYRSMFSLPSNPRWENYSMVFIKWGFYRNFINSLIFAGSVTSICLVLSVPAGYAFALYRFRGRDVLFITILLALTLSEVSLLIPIYQLLNDLKLINTYGGLIFPQVALGLPFAIFLLTTFFREIPAEVLDAGKIDGCSDLRLLWNIVLPLGMPAIKAVSVMELMWAWNSFFFPFVVTTKYHIMPLSVSLMHFKGRYTMQYGSMATTCVIMLLPMVVLYLVMQKSFVRGITFGAVKG